MSPSYNLRAAADQVLSGARVEGLILDTILKTSEAISPKLDAWPESVNFFDHMLRLIEKINTPDNNDMRAYCALVTKVWPALPLHVSTSEVFLNHHSMYI